MVAAIAAAALITLGCAACRDNLATPGDSSSDTTGGAQASTELSGIQSTLDSIESDMSGDAKP